MAQFTRVHGDLKPVLRLDAEAFVQAGANAVVSGATVQPQGPKLNFFTATHVGALSGTQLSAGVQAIQQLGTIHMYRYVDDTNDSFAFAIYPTGRYLAADIKALLVAAGWNADTSVAASATFA